MLKKCVWNKAFLVGPTFLLNLERHYLYGRKGIIDCDPMCVSVILKLVMVIPVIWTFSWKWIFAASFTN